MLKLNHRIEEMLTENRQYYAFPQAAADEFKRVSFGMFAMQAQVAKHFLEEGVQLFSVTNKCHMVLEAVLLADKVSPRLLWAFAGEDQMAKTQVLAKSCVKGNSAAMACMKMAQHYRLSQHFVFLDHDKEFSWNFACGAHVSHHNICFVRANVCVAKSTWCAQCCLCFCATWPFTTQRSYRVEERLWDRV